MKLKSFLSLAFVLGILSSCGINDLEDRLDKVEDALGTNEPLSVDFLTTNLDGADIAKETSYLFKRKGYYEYIEDNQDGTYDVYIERFSDVDMQESAWIYFEYNSATQEVSDESAGVQYYDKSGRWINPGFYDGDAGNTISITVNALNAETGAVNVKVTASTDETATNNEYAGQPMSCTFSFKGKLDVFLD